MNSNDKLKSVIDHGLCTRCGSCVGLSGGHIKFADKTAAYLPEFHGDPDEKTSNDIWNACSGKEVDFPGLTEYVFGDQGVQHPYIGRYLDLNIGFATDPEVRRAGGSAGVISMTLIWMLENYLIDGAVVLGMSKEEPWMNKPFIAKTKEEVLSAAQSKYTISSNNEILDEIGQFKGKLAYVGLPCQVHSIRKLQKQQHSSVKNIKYIIAPFCGLNLHFSSLTSFLRSHGEKNTKDIVDVQFRHGEWPGNMRVEMKDGKVLMLPKFHANYLIPFHMMKRCQLCVDAANEFTDISVGDAWAPVYEERGKGFSFVVTRTKKGQEILDKMAADNLLDLSSITIGDAVKMHSHMYDNKKRGAFIRIKKQKYRPEYNLPFPVNLGFKRKMFEFWMNLILNILRTRFFTWLIDILPSKLVGEVFNSFKIFWKRITYSVKRKEL